jgi:preprotein translocase subunit SecA
MLNLRKIKHNVLNAKQNQREAEIVAEAGHSGSVTIATNMAGRGTDIKLDDQAKAAGGLAIIGSERHDSRRVDRQLRGRAGRQGDPGSSQFYVSLEDELMRLFGSERIAKVMDRFGYEDGEVIQHSMITKSIERAQKKVEENNFGIRKRLLEYDDVMSKQRQVVYGKRRHALFGDRLALDIQNSFYDLADEIVSQHHETKDYTNFQLEVIRYFSVDTAISEDQFLGGKIDNLTEQLFHEVLASYQRKKEFILSNALPVLNGLYRERGETIQNVAIPFADAKKGINVLVPLEETVKNDGKDLMTYFEKNVALSLIDDAWKDHLRFMDDLKQEVQTAGYEQKDPLVIYKIESFNLFKTLISNINKEIASFLFKGMIPVTEPEQLKAAKEEQTSFKGLKESRTDIGTSSSQQQQGQNQAPQGEEPVKKPEPIRVGEKTGRNEPCPCGSGKKFKNCHGKDE